MHPFNRDDSELKIKLRECTLRDVQAVSELCGRAFGNGNFPGIERGEFLDQLEDRYTVAVQRVVSEKLTESINRKAQVGDWFTDWVTDWVTAGWGH